MRLSLRFGVIAVLVAGSVVACGSNGLGGLGGGGSSSGNPEPDPTNIGQQARADLKACSTGTSETSFDDSLEIASGFRQSCHELVVCGGLGSLHAVALPGERARVVLRDMGLTALRATDAVLEG